MSDATDVTRRALPDATCETARGSEGPPLVTRITNRVLDLTRGHRYVLPAMALLVIFGFYPIGYGIALSFAQWNGFSPNWTWVGLENYADVLYKDPIVAPLVHSAVMVTLTTLIALPLFTVAVSLPIAIALNSVRRFRGAFRTIFFLPYVTTGVAVYYAWVLMYQPNGVINTILKAVHLGQFVARQGFLGAVGTALPACLVVMIWSGVPIAIVLYLAGLQTVDQDLVDAVRVDGGGWLSTLRNIYFPLLKPVTGIIIILQIQQALQGVAIFIVMTNGGPINSTTTLGVEIYQLAFGSSENIGYANALGWLMFLGAVVLAVATLRLTRKST